MIRVLIAAFFVLGACDDAGPGPQAHEPPIARANPAMESAAERECAEMTDYQPAKLAGMSSEMRALMQREYALCVGKVSGGN
jgi:hypothetical protein